jgi:membrane protein implicated in regulation of membrane protease activity
MTENSTESQSNNSTQSFWESSSKIVDSLLKAIGGLPKEAQFGAFFLVVVLVATIITTLSLSSDDGKLRLIFVFFSVFSLFVILLYAFGSRQISLENDTTKLKKAENNLEEATNKLQVETNKLQVETNKRINGLQFIQNQLKDIRNNLQELPSNAEVESLKRKTDALLGSILKDLKAIDGYRRDLAAAEMLEARTKDPDFYERFEANYSENTPKKIERN